MKINHSGEMLLRNVPHFVVLTHYSDLGWTVQLTVQDGEDRYTVDCRILDVWIDDEGYPVVTYRVWRDEEEYGNDDHPAPETVAMDDILELFVY